MSKYVLLFVLVSVGLAGIIVLSLSYVEERAQWHETLESLGNFGSFLSGIGTIIAAGAAVFGVDNWVKQLKKGRFLNVIWGTKVHIKKLESAFVNWDVLNFYRPNKDLEKERNVVADISNLHSELTKLALEVDVLNKESKQKFSSLVIDLQLAFKERLDHYETFSQLDNSLSADSLMEFEKKRDTLKNKQCSIFERIDSTLDKLEIQYD